MIFDKNQMLSDDQAITTTAISENVIQWPTPGTVHGAGAAMDRRLGDGNPVPLLVQVTEDFATLTSLTMTLESDSVAGLSSSPTVHWSSGAVPLASLVAGFQVPIRFMPTGIIGEYMGLRFTVAGSAATAGKITAGITAGISR